MKIQAETLPRALLHTCSHKIKQGLHDKIKSSEENPRYNEHGNAFLKNSCAPKKSPKSPPTQKTLQNQKNHSKRNYKIKGFGQKPLNVGTELTPHFNKSHITKQVSTQTWQGKCIKPLYQYPNAWNLAPTLQ